MLAAVMPGPITLPLLRAGGTVVASRVLSTTTVLLSDKSGMMVVATILVPGVMVVPSLINEARTVSLKMPGDWRWNAVNGSGFLISGNP